MVNGLDLFKEHFKAHTDSFVIIGGTACNILLENAGLNPRATNDIDMVLYVEVMKKKDFGTTFWEFIKKGGYEIWQKSPEKKNFFRFIDPADKNYPQKIELLSSKPDGFDIPEGSRFTPIPVEDEVSSLSAILMDGDYYSFLREGQKIVRELPILDAGHLIPLKAKAYLDLSKRKAAGEEIHADNIKKHKNDVFRLYQLLTEDTRITLSAPITEDMKLFLQTIQTGQVDLKNFGIKTLKLPELLENLKTIYGL